MLQKHYTNKIIFLNIETVPQYAKFEDMNEAEIKLFFKKYKEDYLKIKALNPQKLDGTGSLDEKGILELLYNEKAGLSPEFGKIACISFLVLSNDSEYRAMSISGSDEKVLLAAFLSACLSIADWPKVDADKKKTVCSYSGFGFTWPFIAHRFLLNYLPIPPMFDYSEGKPWEQEHLISLMNIWNYNRSSSYTSLATLAHSFGVEHEDKGPEVSSMFYSGELDKLKEYSLQRTVSLATVYLRIKGIKNNIIKSK